MRSRSAFSWLLAKEWRELVASRAWWIMLALVGPFVGLSFISSVRTYSELSAGSGGAGGAEVFSVLDGIWAPTFSAYELVAMFLLPFVAIRLVSGDRQSGALKLELQQRMSPFTRILAKALVLLAGWMLTGGAAIAAIGLWKLYGGATFAPEILVIAAGHVINAGLTVAFAAAAASIAENASTAAILTLSFTVGTWVLQFLAAVHGGVWEQLAGYTPMAVVASFQHGLLPLDTVLVSAILIVAGLAIAATWIQLGVAIPRRVFAIRRHRRQRVGARRVRVARSRAAGTPRRTGATRSRRRTKRRSSRFAAPLRIEAHLAPQDPRRFDLEHQALSKLRRVMPGVRVTYTSSTSLGLYEQAAPGYGEIWYELGGRRAMSRMTTAEGVLETIFGLAGVTPGSENEPGAAGHPLVARPVGASVVFYGVWPVVVAGLAVFVFRRHV